MVMVPWYAFLGLPRPESGSAVPINREKPSKASAPADFDQKESIGTEDGRRKVIGESRKRLSLGQRLGPLFWRQFLLQ